MSKEIIEKIRKMDTASISDAMDKLAETVTKAKELQKKEGGR